MRRPAGIDRGPGVTGAFAERQDEVDVVVVVQGEADLLEVIDALRSAGGLAGGLHGRQEQRDEHANDCDDHEQLDERKSASFGDHGINSGNEDEPEAAGADSNR